jgi:AraC family transcriptional regulator
LNGEILADSRSLQWSDLYVRLCRFPRVVDRFLVPATAEPHISCTIVGSTEFLERHPGGKWLTRHIRRGDIFVTRSRTSYEVSFRSPAGEELETIAIHVGIDSFRAALEAIYPGNASGLEVIDFFGRDVALSHLCAACADLLSVHVPGSSRIVAAITKLFATYLADKYTSATSGKPEVRGGLPIRQLKKAGGDRFSRCMALQSIDRTPADQIGTGKRRQSCQRSMSKAP